MASVCALVAFAVVGAACARRTTTATTAAPSPHRAAQSGEVALPSSQRVSTGRIARVALSVDAVDATVGATGGWTVSVEDATSPLSRVARAGSWRVERRGRALRLVGAEGMTPWHEGTLIVRAAASSFATVRGRPFRGELWLHATTNGVTIVNRVDVEDYLRGVVPLELDAFAPSDAAALQAQAVAARSYVYSRLPEFEPRAIAIRQAAAAFDLRATTSDQVYGGVEAERAPTDRAIATTAGLVIRYEGMVVSAPYHSACGGSTAAPDELWHSENEPWLRRVSDRVPGTNRHYCDIAPRFAWTRTWEESELRGVLAQYLRGANRPRESVRDVEVVAHSASGRVRTLAVTTDAGRSELQGNDIRFAIRTVGGAILPSTYFSVDAAHDASGRLTRLTIRGNGNGHGVGMCQWGAVGRARAGQDFRAILRAYFPGTTIEPAE